MANGVKIDREHPKPVPVGNALDVGNRRKLAVGWFDNMSFRAVCAPHLGRIREVYFAWPGVKAARPPVDWTPARRAQFVEDLRWARSEGVELDAVFNAHCYGDIAMTETLADFVSATLEEMGRAEVFPEHLTTTSPFIATVVRARFPQVKIRASVNSDLAGEHELECVADLFDSFYAGRGDCRRLDYVKGLSAWAAAHGKELGLWANQGCLRNCPFHTFHNNLHGHDRVGQSAAAAKFRFTNFLCRTTYERGRYVEFLKSQWIRPEDLPLYEPYVSVVKLATRRHPHPDRVIRAYATCACDGDLAEITDPFFRFPHAVDNAALGRSALWPHVRDCVEPKDCDRCGKCAALLAEVTRERVAAAGELSSAFGTFFKG